MQLPEIKCAMCGFIGMTEFAIKVGNKLVPLCPKCKCYAVDQQVTDLRTPAEESPDWKQRCDRALTGSFVKLDYIATAWEGRDAMRLMEARRRLRQMQHKS